MRNLLILALLGCAHAFGAVALVAHTAAATSNTNNVTTSGIDTTGATLIVIAVNSLEAATVPAITDSKSNVWVQFSTRGAGTGNGEVTILYSLVQTVGSSHTFTATQTSSFMSIEVQAFSGTLGSIETFRSAASLTPGSVTPFLNNSLVVTAVNSNGTVSGFSLTGGFTISDSNAGTPGTSFGGSMAYLIQTSAAAANPTWTTTGGSNPASIIYVFAATPASGGGQVGYPTVN